MKANLLYAAPVFDRCLHTCDTHVRKCILVDVVRVSDVIHVDERLRFLIPSPERTDGLCRGAGGGRSVDTTKNVSNPQSHA